jgi:hypothetical protein
VKIGKRRGKRWKYQLMGKWNKYGFFVGIERTKC